MSVRSPNENILSVRVNIFGIMCQTAYAGVILVSEVTLRALYECEKSQ